MKSFLAAAAFLAVSSLAPTSRAQSPGEDVEPLPTSHAPLPAEDVEPSPPSASGVVSRRAPPPAPPSDHPTPRLKLAYVRYSAANIDGSAMPLEALQLDMYAISWQWLRVGLDAEAGRGHAVLGGAKASVEYGLIGGNLGLQLPGRVTPFIEGRIAGGILGGTLDGPLTIPGTSVTVNGVSAATWMYARGVDAGAEIYTVGRAYVSVGVGWLRTSWGTATYDAMVTAQGGSGLQFHNVTHDSFLFKIGVGI